MQIKVETGNLILLLNAKSAALATSTTIVSCAGKLRPEIYDDIAEGLQTKMYAQNIC
jgi:hypothetical protein